VTNTASPQVAAERRDRLRAHAALALGIAGMFALDWFFIPRLTNAHFGDIEFTGWSGPMGSRLLAGDRPYVDFVLPIPPGSFAVLAAIEWALGKSRVLSELWLDAGIHLVMAWLAYAMVRPVVSRRSAALAALSTLVTIIQLNKECAYDHTAQLTGWASVALGMRALLVADGSRARRWVAAGAFAGVTLAFKQSTAVGIVGGWILAFVYLAIAERASGRDSKRWREPAASCATGLVIGLGLVWLLLVTLGSTARAFVQATFVDASTLKGGGRFLVKNLIVYLFDFPAFPASLAMVAVASWVGYRVVRRSGTLAFAPPTSPPAALRNWELALLVVITVGMPIAGALVLVYGPPLYPLEWIYLIDRFKQVPTLGLITLVVIFTANLLGPLPPANGENATRSGHALNAAVIAALACSLLHNTSAPEFRPFYDNNAIIPLAFASLYATLETADLRWLSMLVLFLLYGSAAGNKFFRAMNAIFPGPADTHWAGLRLSDRGLEISRAAARARQLAGPDGTVLVLPEDVQIAALVGRARPPILGAIVFVDQYAPRLTQDDIDRLDENPPKVVIIHPRNRAGWQRFFRIWSGSSGAERVIDHVLTDMLPSRYTLDSSYHTSFLYEASFLDVYVRSDAPGAGKADP